MKSFKIDTIEKAEQAAKDQGVKYDYVAAPKTNKHVYFFLLHSGLSNISEVGFWVKAANIVIFHTLPRSISLEEYRTLERMGDIGNPTGTYNANTKLDPRFPRSIK